MLIRINPESFPRWMCSVEGDYDYFDTDNVPEYEEYKSNIIWYIENGKGRLIIELKMKAAEGIKTIFKDIASL